MALKPSPPNLKGLYKDGSLEPGDCSAQTWLSINSDPGEKIH